MRWFQLIARVCVAAAVSAAALCGGQAAGAEPTRPNILFILADD